MVDSGAVYSVLRRADWRALRLEPERALEFVLADGTTITREVSECTFEIQGRRATSPVVLGDSEDEALLGAVTLGTLGLMLNPLNRTLQPMRMVLARASPPALTCFSRNRWRTGGSSVMPSLGAKPLLPLVPTRCSLLYPRNPT